MTVEIVIDELVLRGIDHEGAGAVAGALRESLTALGQDRQAPRSRDETVRRTRDVSAPAGSPAALGGAVAGAVADAVWESGR